MRMWLVNPSIMCRQHLLGEHLEVHMFLSSVKKGKKLDGFVRNNLFEPMSIFQRHEDLKNEMINRGYNHKSPMTEYECHVVFDMPNELRIGQINKDLSLKTLLSRCSKCRENWDSINFI